MYVPPDEVRGELYSRIGGEAGPVDEETGERAYRFGCDSPDEDEPPPPRDEDEDPMWAAWESGEAQQSTSAYTPTPTHRVDATHYQRSREAMAAGTFSSWDTWDEFDPRGAAGKAEQGSASKDPASKRRKAPPASAAVRCVRPLRAWL